MPSPERGGEVNWNLRAQATARLALVLLMLYFFLVAIKLFSNAVKIVGEDTALDLFNWVENPFAGLAVGILATVLVQSSSVTTSTIVAMVGAGAVVGGGDALPLEYAVPMVMGANIGTSVTNTLVALGHVTRSAEFRRAFAGATVHDLFNFLTVLVLFPLELATGYLQKTAQWLVEALPLAGAGGTFHSPINSAVKWLAGTIQSWLKEGPGIDGGLLAALLAIIALAMIVGALFVITKNMRLLVANQVEEWLNRVLGQRGFVGLGIGIVMTVLVQSSSITTSLLVPMFGAGVLTLGAGFPIMLGANIGTTITALIAATVSGPAGLTIAIVHLLFNVSGKQINEAERQIRRELVVHASVHGATQFPPSLVLMSIVKDAERVGDYAKNIFDVATVAPRPPEGEHRKWFAEVRTGVLQLMAESRDVFESNDKHLAAEVIERAKEIEDFCDQKVRELIRGSAAPDLAPSYVLAYRYFKRVASHVRNVTSSIVLPLHKLDFTHDI